MAAIPDAKRGTGHPGHAGATVPVRFGDPQVGAVGWVALKEGSLYQALHQLVKQR